VHLVNRSESHTFEFEHSLCGADAAVESWSLHDSIDQLTRKVECQYMPRSDSNHRLLVVNMDV
jgi:hypothetical protein